MSTSFDESSSKATLGVGEIVDGVDIVELIPLHSVALVDTGVVIQCLSISPINISFLDKLVNMKMVRKQKILPQEFNCK